MHNLRLLRQIVLLWLWMGSQHLLCHGHFCLGLHYFDSYCSCLSLHGFWCLHSPTPFPIPFLAYLFVQWHHFHKSLFWLPSASISFLWKVESKFCWIKFLMIWYSVSLSRSMSMYSKNLLIVSLLCNHPPKLWVLLFMHYCQILNLHIVIIIIIEAVFH